MYNAVVFVLLAQLCSYQLLTSLTSC